MNMFLKVVSALFFAFVMFASAVNPNIPGWLTGVGIVVSLGGYVWFGIQAKHERGG